MEYRLEQLIKGMNGIDPTVIHDGSFMLNGTSLQKLAETGGPGYHRVIAWMEKKLESHHTPEMGAAELVTAEVIGGFRAAVGILKDEQKDLIELALEKSLALYRERKGKYGDSWKVLSASSTANLIEMKANRAAKMGDENAKSLDEALDIVNYGAMLYVKLNEGA